MPARCFFVDGSSTHARVLAAAFATLLQPLLQAELELKGGSKKKGAALHPPKRKATAQKRGQPHLQGFCYVLV